VAGDRSPDQLLVDERPVHVGGVEEVDAELERSVDGARRLAVVPAGVELGHAHATEAKGGDGWAVGPEIAHLHSESLSIEADIGR
jgi:hypothetical protein